MAKHYPNPKLVKIHHSYTVEEVAQLLDKHKNTVRAWIKEGLPVSDDKRPILILGCDLRVFLEARRVKKKRPCKQGEMYCFSCKAARKPVPDLLEYKPCTEKLGRLMGLCPECNTIMYRSIGMAKLKQDWGQMNISFLTALEGLGESDKPI